MKVNKIYLHEGIRIEITIESGFEGDSSVGKRKLYDISDMKVFIEDPYLEISDLLDPAVLENLEKHAIEYYEEEEC